MPTFDFVIPITNPDLDTIIVSEPHSLIPPQPFTLAGGKGFNIARALRILKQPMKVVALVSPDQTEFFKEALEDLGIESSTLLPFLEETRVCRTTIDAVRGFGEHDSVPRRSALRESGHWDEFLIEISKLFPTSSALLLSGKLPDHAPDDAYARCIAEARQHNLFSSLDTRGRLLRAAIGERPDLIKPNISEVQEAMGLREDDTVPLDSLLDFAYELVRDGAKCVAVSGGPQGALLVDKYGFTRYYVPSQPEKNPVGSGDTMVAVITHFHVSQGYSMQEAVQMGVAYSAAQVQTTTPGEFSSDTAGLLAGRIEVSGRRFGPSLTRTGSPTLDEFHPNARFLSVANRDPRFRLDDSILLIKPREDRVVVTSKCAVIADGITLRSQGAYCHPSPSADAARLFCETISSLIDIKLSETCNDPEEILRQAFKYAEKEIFFLNRFRQEEDVRKLGLGGAIGIAALINDDELHVMHIGDASAIVITDEGEAIKITTPQDLKTNSHLETIKETIGEDAMNLEKRRLCNMPPGGEDGKAYGVITGDPNAASYLEYIIFPLTGVKYLVLHTDGFDNLTSESIVSFAQGKIGHEEILLQNHVASVKPKRPRSDDRSIIAIEIS